MARPKKEPLRAMSEQEEREVQRLVEATSEPLDVVSGKPFTEAASVAGEAFQYPRLSCSVDFRRTRT